MRSKFVTRRRETHAQGVRVGRYTLPQGGLTITAPMFIERVIHGIAGILGCFVGASLLVKARLPGGEVNGYQ